MKRGLAMALALALLVSVTACAGGQAKDGAGLTPLQVLVKVWDAYEDGERFEASGGDPANVTDGKPGKFDITDRESLDARLGFPQASAALIDDAASLSHRIGNTFTAGAYHVTDENEIELLTADLQDNILNRQWTDTVPDKLFIVKVGADIVITVFGREQQVDTFKEKLLSVYSDVKIYAEQAIE